MNTYILQTERLALRPFLPTDARDMFRLNSDPEVIRYTGDAPFDSETAALDFLLRYDHYDRYGFGRWAVLSAADSRFLGWCGLRFSEELQGVDLGFRFFRRCWGQGYATEAAAACADYGLGTLGIPTLWGRAMAANTASIRVLEKIGFDFVKKTEFALHEGVLYKKNRPSIYPSSSSLSHS